MTYTPDTRQRLARSTRFFAYLESFTLECPHCGKCYQIRVDQQRPSLWNPRTARFTCAGKGGCSKVYILGMLAWPTASSTAKAIPRDQIPNIRQLTQLRKEGGGWWLPDDAAPRGKVVHETNLTLEEDRPVAQEEADEE